MARVDSYTQVEVSIPGHQYPVLIARNGLSDADLLKSLVHSNQVMVVTNKTIAPLYLDQVQSSFADYQCDTLILEDGEEHKNQQNLFALYDALIDKRHHRDTTLIALGGGVIGDLTGFAAATYQRGVGLIQIPTSLLAQVDAAIGGKTAINHPTGKNMIGSFYQPSAVLIDVNTLATLPEREFKAGIAEIIKYALLVGGEFLIQLRVSLAKGLTAQSPELANIIQQCCQIKAQFVVDDEKEVGARALLNLGHTFAHALEAYTKYQYWLHGEAVAIGLYCASILSVKLGLNDDSLIAEVENLLIQAGLPHKIPGFIQLDQLEDLMSLDKKVKNNCLRFIVIKKPGNCYLEDKITKACLHDTLIAAVEGENNEKG